MSAAGANTLHGADGGLPGVSGDYYGRVTRRLEGAGCWVEVLAAGGPRIVGFGLRGGPNVLAETPDMTWDSGFGRYELLGGHRLWFAPETLECSVPDQHGLTISAIAGGLRLVGAVEPPTGLRKAIEIRLHSEVAALSVRHELLNEGSRTLELSPWAITQLRLGGVAVVELPTTVVEHILVPNQVLVLWPYSSWADDRMSIGERAITVTGRPAKPFKLGFLSHRGSAGYLRDGLLFVKRFDPAVAAVHADLGSNVQIYCDERTIELESLGPLVRLMPGESTTHEERWELRDIGTGADVAAAAAFL
jgi:hypothetical protein